MRWAELFRSPPAEPVLTVVDPVADAAAAQDRTMRLARQLAAQLDLADDELARKELLRQLARAERLSLQLKHVKPPFRDKETDKPLMVLALARAHAHDGTWDDGDGAAAASEAFFDDVRDSDDQLEAKMRSTAATRALSRAIENALGVDLDRMLRTPSVDPADADELRDLV